MKKPILAKYIFEIRYPAAAIFHDKRGAICQKIQNDEFEHWRLDSLIVNSYNEAKTRFAFSTSKNAGMHFEFPQIDYHASLLKYIRIITRELDLNKLSRVGVRLYLLYPTESLDSAKEIYSKSVFNIYLDVISNIGNAIDFGCTFDFDFDPLKGHLTFGPMDSKQLFEMFVKGEIDKENVEIPESFIFFDFDLFQVENYAFKKTDELVDHLVKYCVSAENKIIQHVGQLIKAFEQRE